MNVVISVVALASAALVAAIPAVSQSAERATCARADESQIAALFDRWNTSLRSGDVDRVAANYAPDSVLLATVSNQPRTTPAAIREYFVKFMKDKPVGKIDSRTVKLGCNVAQDVGTYTFRFATGKVVHARYTYVYEWMNGKWLIAHHHSSSMPEPVLAAVEGAENRGAKRAVYDSKR